jgi:hypothetical protein
MLSGGFIHLYEQFIHWSLSKFLRRLPVIALEPGRHIMGFYLFGGNTVTNIQVHSDIES